MLCRIKCFVFGVLCCAAFLPCQIFGEAYTVKVIEVIDGDTLKIAWNNESQFIQLYGVKTPVKWNHFYNEAKLFTDHFVLNHVVEVKRVDNQLPHVMVVKRFDGKVLNNELLEKGLAKWDKQNAPNDQKLKKLEAKAKKGKRGIWGDSASANKAEKTKEKTLPHIMPIQDISLSGGESAFIDSEDLQLVFDSVAEDSRCPKGAQCIWSGRVVIVLNIKKLGHPEKSLRVTHYLPHEKSQYLDYMIEVLHVSPAPPAPKKKIPLKDYKVQLRISKMAG